MNDFSARWFFWVPGIIRRDFLRKLIALSFAVLLWKKVSTQIGAEQVIRGVPVTITVPAGVELLSGDSPPRIDVTVRSSQRRLNLLQFGEVKAAIHFRGGLHLVGGGEPVQLRIRREDVQVPAGVTVLGVRPEFVSVNLDRRITRELPVRCVMGGELMDNYAYGEVRVRPTMVKVAGPEGVLRLLEEIETRPIILQRENTDSFETEVELLPRPGLTATPGQVQVQVEIYRRQELRSFPGLPVGVMRGESRSGKLTVRLGQDRVDVIVRGVRDAVTGLSEQSLRPFVDLSGIDRPGTHRLPVQVWVAAREIEVRSINPPVLDVLVGETR